MQTEILTCRNGIGGHHSARYLSDDWLTPPSLLLRLGAFDLDPCFSDPRPWDTAKEHYGEFGLEKEWRGRVWLNPPYGLEATAWLAKLAAHGCGTALIFARTETAMFFDHVWHKAAAVLFIRGRLYFHRPDGTRATANSGAPSVLVAYGMGDAEALRVSGIDGKYISLRSL